MDAKNAQMLTRYNAWANKLMFDAVAKLPEGEAVKPRISLFKNMVHTLNHNYVIGLIWRAHLEGRDHGMTARNTPDYPPLSELWQKQQAIDGWYVDWSDQLTDEKLDTPVSFENEIGKCAARVDADTYLIFSDKCRQDLQDFSRLTRKSC